MAIEDLIKKQQELMLKVPHTVRPDALAYMKGVVDSEGCYDGYRLRITTTSEELACWLTQNFGGSLCKQKPSVMTKHQAYQWGLTRAATAGLMSVLPDRLSLPRLSVKQTYAYIAGLVDGDSVIYLHKRTRNGREQSCPRVVFTSSGTGLAEYIQSVYGGSMSILQPRVGYREKMPYTYLLIAGKARAGGMIRDMLPYLVVKRNKAEEVLACLG